MTAHTLKQSLADCRGSLRVALIAAGALSLAVNLLVLAVPIYSMQVFDRVLSSRSLETLAALTVLVLGLLALQAALDHARGTLLRRAALGLDHRLGAHVLQAGLSESVLGNPHAAGSLRDLREVRTVVASPGLTALFDLPIAPLFVLVVTLIHPLLGLFVVVATLLLAALAAANVWAARRPQDDGAAAALRAGEEAQGYLDNAEAARALGMEDALLARWRRRNGQLLALDAGLGGRVAAVLTSTKFARMAIQVGLTGLGAMLAVQGAITAGAMIASSLLMARALAPVEHAVGGWRSWRSAWSAGRRLRAAFEQLAPPAPGLRLPPIKGQLAVSNLHYRAGPAEAPILRGVDFDLAAGNVLALVGPSGSGKSTLMRLLAGVWRPQGGEIRLDGAELSQWPASELGRQLGYLPQNVQLLAGTVAENISRFAEDPCPEEIVAAARRAGVHELILRLPRGYDTEICKGGRQLSGGQQQRIGLARALYGSPRLILLDEPNSNLDPEGEAALVEALRALKAEGRTVVIVSHRPSLLRFVDWIAVLREGRIERAGAPADLLPGFALSPHPEGAAAAPNAVPKARSAG